MEPATSVLLAPFVALANFCASALTYVFDLSAGLNVAQSDNFLPCSLNIFSARIAVPGFSTVRMVQEVLVDALWKVKHSPVSDVTVDVALPSLSHR